MTVESVMKEYGLEIDDIRYYLSHQMMEKMMEYNDFRKDLTHYIWSGRLADDLYEMEDRFLSDLQEDLEKNIIDEPQLNEIMGEVRLIKNKRERHY